MAGTGPNNDVLGWGRVGKLLTDAVRIPAAGLAAVLRTTQYGEYVVQLLSAKPYGCAAEGSYFFCRTPTVATGVASITTPTTFADTSPALIVTNNNPFGGKDVILDFIKMTCTVAGTAAADLQWATKLDVIPRYSSGGSGGAGTGLASVLSGPYPTHSGAGALSNALVYAGALVAVAASTLQRLLQSGNLRTTIMVAKDQVVWNFGGHEQQIDTLAIGTATATQRFVPHVPVVIAPGHSFLLYKWSTSQSAADQNEFEVGFVER